MPLFLSAALVIAGGAITAHAQVPGEAADPCEGGEADPCEGGEADPCEGGEAMPTRGLDAEAANVMMAPPPEEEPAPVATSKVGYDKGFFIGADNDKGTFELKIKARVQVQSAFDSTAGDPGEDRTTNAQFQVRRARLTLEGHAWTKKLLYKFQSDFGTGFLTLKDFIIDGQVADKVWIRAGQWKRPLSRQQINSSGQLELVDRAIVDGEFRNGRDIGVAIHNNYEKSPDLEWVLGVFNGQGDKANFGGGVANPDTGVVTGGGFSSVPKKLKPVIIGRVGINRGGIKGYSEADLEGGPLRFAAAASVWIEGDYEGGDSRSHQVEADFVVKVEGLSASGSVYMATTGSGAATDPNLLGFHAQVGKVFGEKTKRMQAVGRYAALVPIGDNEDAMEHEITVGAGWLPYGHDVKLQLDIGPRLTEGGGFGDRIVGRLQLSAGF